MITPTYTDVFDCIFEERERKKRVNIIDDDVENDGGNRERKTPSSSSKVFIYIKAVSANKKNAKKNTLCSS